MIRAFLGATSGYVVTWSLEPARLQHRLAARSDDAATRPAKSKGSTYKAVVESHLVELISAERHTRLLIRAGQKGVGVTASETASVTAG